jgi:hypothetical protein
MFRALKADDSPVDAVGFSIQPGDGSLRDLEAGLEERYQWCRRAPGQRPVLVFESTCSPRTNGGELGQWNVHSRVLHFGNRARDLLGVALNGLYDRERDYGIVRRSGRRTLTYRNLAGGGRRDAMRLPRTAPAQPPAGSGR